MEFKIKKDNKVCQEEDRVELEYKIHKIGMI